MDSNAFVCKLYLCLSHELCAIFNSILFRIVFVMGWSNFYYKKKQQLNFLTITPSKHVPPKEHIYILLNKLLQGLMNSAEQNTSHDGEKHT